MCDYCDCRLVPAIADLTDDHEILLGLTARLRHALAHDDGATVRATVAALSAELAAHTDREERGIFAALRAADDLTGSYVGRFEAEHVDVHERLRPDAAAGALTDVIAALEAHIAREETDLFPAARQVLSPSDWDAVERAHLDDPVGATA